MQSYSHVQVVSVLGGGVFVIFMHISHPHACYISNPASPSTKDAQGLRIARYNVLDTVRASQLPSENGKTSEVHVAAATPCRLQLCTALWRSASKYLVTVVVLHVMKRRGPFMLGQSFEWLNLCDLLTKYSDHGITAVDSQERP